MTARRATLVALTVVGFLLRAYDIGARTTWLDEADTASYTDAAWSAPFARAFDGPPITTPPVYFEVVHAAAKVGLGGARNRLLSLFAGTASIPALFLLGAEVASPAAGLCGATMITVSPILVRYSREARPYALLVLATILFLLGAIRVVKRDTPRDRMLFLCGGAFCALLQFAGVVVAAIVALWTFATRRTLACFSCCAAIAACASVTAAQAWVQHGTLADLMPHTGGLRFSNMRALNGFLLNTMGVDRLDWPRASIVVIVAPFAIGVLVLLVRRAWTAILLLAAAALPIVAMAMPKLGYRYTARYAIHAVPIVCLVAGVGLGALIDVPRWRVIGRALATTMLCAWCLLATPEVWRQLHEGYTPYDVAGALVRELGDPTRDRVFILGLEEPMFFYGPQNVRVIREFLDPRMPVDYVITWADSPRPPGFDDAWLIGWDSLKPQPPLDGPILALHLPSGPTDVQQSLQARGGAHSGLLVRPPLRLRDAADAQRLLERARALHPWAHLYDGSSELP